MNVTLGRCRAKDHAFSRHPILGTRHPSLRTQLVAARAKSHVRRSGSLWLALKVVLEFHSHLHGAHLHAPYALQMCDRTRTLNRLASCISQL
jgi:hypothetical protein